MGSQELDETAVKLNPPDLYDLSESPLGLWRVTKTEVSLM